MIAEPVYSRDSRYSYTARLSRKSRAMDATADLKPEESGDLPGPIGVHADSSNVPVLGRFPAIHVSDGERACRCGSYVAPCCADIAVRLGSVRWLRESAEGR